jgi:hypothetical protein
VYTDKENKRADFLGVLRIEIDVENTVANKMFAQWWRDVKLLSTFILQRLPTRTVAASEAHHCANTNVGGHTSGRPKNERKISKITFPNTGTLAYL